MRFRTGLLVASLCAFAGSLAAADQNVLPQAGELIKTRRFNDAIKLLTADIQGKSEDACGTQFLLLGEAHYRAGQYDPARTAFTKALKNLSSATDKAKADYRLACALYRLGDFTAALERIDGYAAQRAVDAQVGTLLVYKMSILAPRGRGVQAELEGIHQKLYADSGKIAANTLTEADQILCNFFAQNGMADKAFDLFARILNGLRKQIQQAESQRAQVPAAVGAAHDQVCLQLGALYLERKKIPEARQHLETVRFDSAVMAKARLLLAKLAYETGDHNGAQQQLLRDGFIDLVPASGLKSDMFLLLGLSEKAKSDGNPAKVENWLRKVGADSQGYAQVQNTLGDLYREKALTTQAAPCYERVLATGNTAYAANALFHLGKFELDQGLDARPAQAAAHFAKSREYFAQLFTRFPLAPETKKAPEHIAVLTSKGQDTAFARSADDQLKLWERTAKDRPGSSEAAESLLSLARHHAKTLVEEKTRKVLKAPDWMATAAACDRLLDERAFTGAGLAEESWAALRAEAGLLRGSAEIASVQPPEPKRGEVAPVWRKDAKAETAVAILQKARATVPPKRLELVKSIELALLEAMLKSPVPEHRIKAEARYQELEGEYGADPRFQKLALDLGDWYRDQSRFAEAGKQYAGVADRGRELAAEDLTRLYFTAGSLYSRAGREALKARDLSSYVIQIGAKAGIDLGDEVRRTYAPLSKRVELTWPNGGKQVLAGEALVALSKTAGIPLVWTHSNSNSNSNSKSNPTDPKTIAGWLATTRRDLADGSQTVAEALDRILDPAFRVAFDVGLSGGKPTIEPPAAAEDDPDHERVRVLEIYDSHQGLARFPQLAARIGRINTPGRAPMLYDILKQIEAATRLRVTWTPGIDKEGKLAAEFKDAGKEQQSCAEVLTTLLASQSLQAQVVRQDVAGEWYEFAKDCFNKVRKLDPKSNYGERALFMVAINFYSLKDYERMRAILREYLKVFDQPAYEYWHQANFWIGWILENEKKFNEAVTYYARAAEERVVVYRPKPGPDAKPAASATPAAAAPASATPETKVPDAQPPEKPKLDREAVRALMAYDTQFVLGEKVTGALKDAGPDQFTDFMRIQAHVNLVLDPTAQTGFTPINRPAIAQSGFDLLCDVLEEQGLAVRIENLEPPIAERAYFRLASAYRKDGLMPQALENAQLLLRRYPETERRRETQGLMLAVYRGLKRFPEVIAMLETLAKEAKDPAEKRRIEIEVAWIRFDMADYAGAADRLKPLLTSAQPGEELQRLRDAYARALMRAGQASAAAEQYALLTKEAALPSERRIAALAEWACKLSAGKASERDFPAEETAFLRSYLDLPDDLRKARPRTDHARATWNYWALAQADVREGRWAKANERLQACASAPDDYLAADALIQLARIGMRTQDWDKARENLEYLLVFTTTAESAVRGTYHLGECLDQLGRKDLARERLQQVVDRFPLSPYAERARARLGLPPGIGAKPVGNPGPSGESGGDAAPVAVPTPAPVVTPTSVPNAQPNAKPNTKKEN